MQKLKQDKQFSVNQEQRSALLPSPSESPPRIETLQKTLQDYIRKLKGAPNDKVAKGILRTRFIFFLLF